MLIGILLLTFMVCINFAELSASGLPEEPRARLTCTSRQKPTWSFYYRTKQVGVWLNRAGKVEAIGLKLGNIIPGSSIRRKYQFRSFVEYQEETFFLVYTLPDGCIAGIENIPWNDYPKREARGATTTITYQRRVIDVWKDLTGKAFAVRLQSRNIVPTAKECREYEVRTDMAQEDNMRFMVYKLRSGYIVGVLLAPGR